MTTPAVRPSPSETTVIRAKDLMQIFGYPERTAFRYLKDIKQDLQETYADEDYSEEDTDDTSNEDDMNDHSNA